MHHERSPHYETLTVAPPEAVAALAVAHTVEGQPLPVPPTARIWIGSLAVSGELTGRWIDAAQEPEALQATVLGTLDPGSSVDAKEWGIFDYEGFGDHNIEEFGQLEAVLQIARGIEEHGPAFAAWAQHLGPQGLDRLHEFQDHYLGGWPSVLTYVESYLEDIGFEHELGQAIKELPESLRRHVKLDVEAVAEERKQQLHVPSKPGGGIWVFQAVERP